MAPVSFDSRAPSRQVWTLWLLWILAPLSIFGLALAGVLFDIPGQGVAVWWPAAGVSVWFALRVPPRQRVAAIAAVFAVTTLANAIPGRELVLCLIFGIANAVEVAIVVLLLRRRQSRFVLRTLVDGLYFLVAVAIGSIVLSMIVGAAAATIIGADFSAVAIVTVASHSSAIMLIAPFAVLPPRIPEHVSWIEIAIQSAFVAAAILGSFRPGATLPLGFLVFAVLAWGAMRFSALIAFTQSLLIAIVVVVLTVLGQGSLVGPRYTALETGIATVAFLFGIAVFTGLLVPARYDSRLTEMKLLEAAEGRADAARERADVLAGRLELERLREDFVATTSHELRTPITSIAGYADLLLESELPDKQRGWVEVIERNVQRLGALVEDLRSARRTRRPSGRPTRLGVRDLAAEAQTVLGPEAAARSVRIDVDIDAQIGVMADPDDAGRALGNLVSNAVKFVPMGGLVRIRAAGDGDLIQISVIDDGPGMSAETLSHAFERFYRGADVAALGAPGTGLGLAIALDLAERNGGSITLTSSEGAGVHAVLRLPKG